jgi:hypothetical protein
MADVQQLSKMLSGTTTLEELAAHCDTHNEVERALAVRQLSGKQMGKLFELAASPTPVGLDLLVPQDTPAHTTVVWEGKNSLPAFNQFCKVFTRLPDGTVIGRNTGSMEWLVGPGYYTTQLRDGKPGEFLINYLLEPANAPPGWPTVKSNKSGASFFVFRNMHDYLRPIGKHVAIGAAYDGPTGKFKGQYFILARGKTIRGA